MSSPTFKPPTTTSSAKDSPTTIVFNSLSPINLSANRPSCQAFDNVDVPSPQPVFSTPQNCLMNSKRCKRFQTLVFPSPPKIFRYDINDAAASLEYPDLASQYIPIPIVQSENFMDGDGKYNSDHHSQDRVCRSPSNVIDEYLSIPSEDCENNSGSSGILLGKADDLVHDKEMFVVSSNVDPMTCPNDIFSQVSLGKSSSMIINSLTECTEHLDLVSMPDMQPEKVALREVFQNNSIAHEESRKEFHVINNVESSNLNVFGQNSSCQLEKNPGRKKVSGLTESTALEEIGTRGGSHGKKPEENFNSFLPLVSSTEHEPVALDRGDLNTNTIDHGDECPSTSSSYLLGRHDAKLFSSRAVYWAQLECIDDVKHKTLRNTRLHGSHHGNSIQTRDASAKSQIPHDVEDEVYHSRCMYKRLQFENIEKRETKISNNVNHMKLDSSHFISERTAMPSNVESPHVSNTKIITTSERVQSLQSMSTNISGNALVKTDSFEQSNGLSTAIVPRSSGIGLHLNAIGVPGQMSSHIDMEMPVEGLGTGGQIFLPDSCRVQTEVLKNMKGQMPVQLVSKSDDSSFGSKGECSKKRPSKPSDYIPNCHSPLEFKSLVNDHHITPFNRERLPFEETSKSEDSTQTSHGKKRGRKVSEIEGQKRCNCKRSKCLKLYCDCFAAGLFCNEACACQGCSNNSEHEEMVSSTKQLIETRNPLAFAPKVVHAKGDLKENGDNKHITPPSARHKRGCNCKKSKCLKKYCECYQAGVGCSLGCRCEGCKNAYGTKEECSDITERVIEHQKPKDDAPCKEPPAKSLEVTHAKTEASSRKQFNRRFTHAAPLVQGMNAKGGSILHLCASLEPSPESNFAALSSLESPTSTMNPKRNSAHSEKIEEPLCIISNQQFDFSSGSKIDSPSPPWKGFAGLDHISPPSGRSPTHCGSSSTSRTGQVTDYERKLVIKPSTSGPDYNLADESPEILRDDHSQINTVKVSSPNKKRVSPPKKKFLEAGSSFSPGLKSGRKYVLHSISQFPSLTPYRNNLKEKSSGGSLEQRESR